MSVERNLLKNLKVLYVEDEEEVLEQMTFFLKKRVGKLIVAKNGKEGLALFKEDRPDMIISDLKMPMMDGISMAREIREISDIPIIITTAFSDKEIILKAVDVGIEKYIIKPLDARALIQMMEGISIKVLRKKGELLDIRNRVLSREEKVNIEEEIKNIVAKFIKDITGKGPLNVKAFIHGNTLEIEINGVFTKLEKALMKKEKNMSMVKYNREVFYKDYEEEMKNIIESCLKLEIELNYIEIDVLSDKNILQFTIY